MRKIALIYTGGTIGMRRNDVGKLTPMEFEAVSDKVPSLKLLPIDIIPVALAHPIDSSEMTPAIWIELTQTIESLMDQVDGFVILHGTDTMAYTACALSFMIQGLRKPVIITGSQLPVGVLRTDAVENLVSAFEFAAMVDENDNGLIQEVCIYFEYQLLRGNRAYKRSSNEFDAFSSPNFPALAESGVKVTVANELLWKSKGPLLFQKKLAQEVGVVTLYPGLRYDQVPVL
jgi:L-asparaginase